MPITLAAPPESVMTELAATLPRIAGSAAVEERAPSITRAAGRFSLGGQMRVARAPADIADADALPIPVYVLGLDQLAEGRLEDGARLALWSHIVSTEAGPVSAEVTSEGSQFAQVSNARAVGRARSSLIRMAEGEGEGADAPDGEAAELRIPALHTSLLWIRGRRPTLEVLDTQLAELRVGRRYSAEELAAILQPIAQQRLRDPEGEG